MKKLSQRKKLKKIKKMLDKMDKNWYNISIERKGENIWI